MQFDQLQTIRNKIRTASGSDRPNTQLFSGLERLSGAHVHELNLWLVAIAPSSDFV